MLRSDRRSRSLIVANLLALALAASACKRETAGETDPSAKASLPAAKGAGPAAGPTGSTGASPADAGAVVADTTEKEGHPEARARALVDLWLAAQNAGTFAPYRDLYGESFTGIRRSGAKVVKLDRTRWLAERERMFRKPMIVRATDIEVTRSDQGDHELVARFVQTWASGIYRDIGNKELWLDDRGDRLLIVREEMLTSRILRELPPDAAVIAHPIIEIDALLLVGLGRAADGATPSAAPRTLGRFQTNVGVFRPIDEKLSPVPSAPWTGRKLDVYGERGPLCQIVVSAFGHAGISRGPDEWSAETDLAKLAELAWRRRGFRADVAVALVESPPESCHGALYGDIGWVFRIAGDDTPTSLGDVCYGRAIGVRAAADLDRDGALDLILQTTGKGVAVATQTGAHALFYIEGNWSNLWWCGGEIFD
jgi:hypothetical protein